MATQPDTKRLLLVSPPAHIARKAAEWGVRLWTLADPRLMPAAELRTLARCSELTTTDESDTAGLLRQVSEAARLHAITELWYLGDGDPAPVHETAWRLGLNPNSPESVRALTAVPGLAGTLAAPGASAVPGGLAITASPRERDFSVETFSAKGAHHVVGVTARRPAGHLHPAPLPAEDQEEAGRAAIEALDAARFRAGPAHVRLRHADGGWQFAGGRAGLPPDRIPLLVGLAREADLEEGLLTGRTRRLRRASAATCYSEIGFFRLAPGRLRTIAGIDSICALPYIRAVHFPFVPGDEVPPGTGHGAEHGYVVVVGDTPEATARRTSTALSLLRADIQQRAA